jgi:hypothetical protein
MGEDDPLGLLAQVDGLSDDDRAAIGGGTAEKVFRLS